MSAFFIKNKLKGRKEKLKKCEMIYMTNTERKKW